MDADFRVGGFEEMQGALEGLKQATAKAVVRRALKKVLNPVAQRADASNFDIAVTTKLSARQQSQSGDRFKRSVVNMYVGPVDDLGRGAPHAHLIEFGTGPRHHRDGKFVGAVMPEPFMRPAWDAVSPDMLDTLKKEIWLEIEKTLARVRARNATRR